ncbi:Lipid droplet-associated hydrolase, partial [Actinidia chinensis var. chinensis]
MGFDDSHLISQKSHAHFRLCNVSGHMTDLIEIRPENPTLHILFIPGNPGVVSFYTDFLENLYELLGGTASVTAVGHISQTKKNWEGRRLFSLEEQIDHKMDFIKHELQNIEVPIILVGHSIGSYISIEMLRRSSERVIYCIALYPFLAVNTESSTQSIIMRLARSPILCAAVSSIVGLLGLLPTKASRFLVQNSVGKTWSAGAIEALCSHLLQYHVMRNVLFLAMTEFKKLSETPDWEFMRGKRSRIAFLFGDDDHWGPLQMFDEISKNVPDATLAVEREGHSHSFSCTTAGSLWVAQHVASLIKNRKASSS